MLNPSKMSKEDIKRDYIQYVVQANRIIHGKGKDAILKSLSGYDPVQNVSDAAVAIMQRVDLAARQTGMEVQDAVKVIAGKDVVDELCDFGEAAGVIKLSPELRQLAFSTAVQAYINAEVKARRIDPKRLQVSIAAELRQMPPKQRKQVMDGLKSVGETGLKYKRSLQKPTGLLAAGGR